MTLKAGIEALLKRLLPDVEYVALEDMGHMPMWDEPDLTARTVLEVTGAPAGAPAA